jgi:hypothetical protein
MKPPAAADAPLQCRVPWFEPALRASNSNVKTTQGVVEAADLHGQYHVSAELARALREAARELLRDEKLPALAAAADRELWLSWVDALICAPEGRGAGASRVQSAVQRPARATPLRGARPGP